MWVEERPNGKFKFCERYTDYLTGDIKRVSVFMDKNTTQTRKLAQRILEQKIQDAMIVKPKHQYTLKELVEEYRKSQQQTVKKSTYTRNFHACNSIIKILGENTIVEHMTARYVRDKFLETGKAPGTLNEALRRFRALIRWGYSNDLLKDASFLEKIENFKDVPHKEKIQDKYLEANELKQLLQEMSDPIWSLLTEFLALSGMRFGEVIALEDSDVDLSAKKIYVTKTFDSVNKVVTSPKSFCSIRDVYIQKELEVTCKKIRALMLRRRLMYGLDKQLLFMFSEKGTHIHYYAYNKYLRENSLRILGRTITPHALRHTHASLLMEQGISIDTISRRLGHENSDVTREIYLHVTKKLQEKDNQQIAKISIL